LRDFVSDHRNCADEFAKQIEDARLDDAKRTVHTLRGVGGNIGAYDLQKVATELEMSLTNGGVPSAAMIKRLAEVCDSLFASINGILPDMEQDATAVTYAKPITEETEKELQALMSALPSGSAQSINLYEKLKPALVDKLESGQLDKLDELIANYDFEEADELLRDALGWDD
jgi:HPt (histidine-containing phosphotransfer) domain-containing protein